MGCIAFPSIFLRVNHAHPHFCMWTFPMSQAGDESPLVAPICMICRECVVEVQLKFEGQITITIHYHHFAISFMKSEPISSIPEKMIPMISPWNRPFGMPIRNPTGPVASPKCFRSQGSTSWDGFYAKCGNKNIFVLRITRTCCKRKHHRKQWEKGFHLQ